MEHLSNHNLLLTVKKIIPETRDVKRFILAPKNQQNQPLPSFGAGAHITLHLPLEHSIVSRHYSIISNPLSFNHEYEIAVKKISVEKGGSWYLHHKVKEGDTLRASPPDNFFSLRFEARHHVLYAAGIGITPILSMMAHLTSLNASFELHYAAKSIETCPFYQMIKSDYGDKATFYFMERTKTRALLKESLKNQPIGTHVYICGPESFIEDMKVFAREAGFKEQNIHVERFRAHIQPELTRPFSVYLQKSKKMIEVPKNRSLLEVLRENEIPIPYSCKMGICGTCEVDVIDGNVLHFDSFLTDEEKKSKLLACVSRGVSQLTLDL
jgi:dimethylamine monooxygenase subunit B